MLVVNMPKIKSEEQFGNIFVGSPSLHGLCLSDSIYVAKELKTSLGVPDYVLLAEKDYDVLTQFAKNYSHIRLSGKYAAVISCVAKNSRVDVQRLAELMNQRQSAIVKALEELESWGIVTLDEGKSFVSFNTDFDIPALQSVAIELKLSSWQKALWQATRNSNQFATSYVVMPSEKLDLLNSKIDLFISNNISTAVFDVDSLSLTPIHTSQSEELATNRHYLEGLGCLIQNLSAFHRVSFGS